MAIEIVMIFLLLLLRITSWFAIVYFGTLLRGSIS